MRAWKPAAAAALGVTMALMLLAGCSKSGGAGNAAAGPAAAPPVSGPDVAINPSDAPHPKAGYWETTTLTNSATSHGSGPEIHHYCSSGKAVSVPAERGHGCSTYSFKRTFLGAVVIDAECAEGPISSKMHMTASGDFNSSYTTDSQVSLIMQGRPASTFTTHSVSRYLGPCPAGAKADD